MSLKCQIHILFILWTTVNFLIGEALWKAPPRVEKFKLRFKKKDGAYANEEVAEYSVSIFIISIKFLEVQLRILIEIKFLLIRLRWMIQFPLNPSQIRRAGSSHVSLND